MSLREKINEHFNAALKSKNKTLVSTLSDGAVLSFGLESADPLVHQEN